MVGPERQPGRALPPEPEPFIGDVLLHQTSHKKVFPFGFFERMARSGLLLICSYMTLWYMCM